MMNDLMNDLAIIDPVLDLPGIRHGFFGRNGGVSCGIYGTLNCGIGSNDDPAAITENRRRIAAHLGAADNALLTLHQVHSASCVTVTAPWAVDARPQADAMVTDRPGIVLGVLTADCAPILLAGTTADGRPVIGAAHAGWGGALGGVAAATVAAMADLGAEPARISAAIGPCIGPESYEVGAEFMARFIAQSPDNAAYFTPAARDGHFMFDLPSYVRDRLVAAGVGRVSIRGVDTYFNEEDYFSYRRSTHRIEPDYGRQVSALVITGAA